MRKIAALIILGMIPALPMAACADYYLYGECSDDDDLKEPPNFWEGAICVDGHAACPDGRPICLRFYDDPVVEQDQLLATCLGPCIECPDNQGACISRTPEKGLRYKCASSPTDCWEEMFYWVRLDSLTKGCPTMSPDCR